VNRIVDKLLEMDIPDDPLELIHQTHNPSDEAQSILRDELVDMGWRHIRLTLSDEGWLLHAGMIDPQHRAEWENSGARVAPAPQETPLLRPRIMRTFKAAARRAGMDVSSAKLTSIRPAYDSHDLYYAWEDFEDDPGDWEIEIELQWSPKDKFWSKASAALGYETKPYQQAGKLAKTGSAKPSPLTPEQLDAADDATRSRLLKAERAAQGSEERADKALQRWRQAGADRAELSKYLEQTDESIKGMVAAGLLGASTLAGTAAKHTQRPARMPHSQIVQTAKRMDTQSPESIIMGYENSKDNPKGGYDKRTGRWYPHRSIEGGSDTIAYGHKIQAGEVYSNGLSDAEATALLRQDIAKRERDIQRNIPAYASLPQYVKNAVISAWYRGDLGPRATPRTLRLINAGQWEQAAREYLNHNDFRNGPNGVKNRMQNNANAFARYAQEKGTTYASH
jgi:GH24 family phage-related lysozyme (muramidase)